MDISKIEDAGKKLDNFDKNSSKFINSLVKNAKKNSELNYKTLFGVFFGCSTLLVASAYNGLPFLFQLPIILTLGISGGIIGAKGFRGLRIERYVDDQALISKTYNTYQNMRLDSLRKEMSYAKKGSKEYEEIRKIYLECLNEQPIIIPLEPYQDKPAQKLLKNGDSTN